jgi:hypothetical protein
MVRGPFLTFPNGTEARLLYGMPFVAFRNGTEAVPYRREKNPDSVSHKTDANRPQGDYYELFTACSTEARIFG